MIKVTILNVPMRKNNFNSNSSICELRGEAVSKRQVKGK
jgi:hypothetical protein